MWHTLRYLTGCIRNSYLSRDQLDALQNTRVPQIITHAKETVPYYRQLLSRGDFLAPISRDRININEIPITRKTDLQDLDKNMIISSSYDLKDLNKVRTGGSTGTPFEVHLDDRLLGRRTASRHRSYIANGYSFFDRVANLQFQPTETNRALTRLGILCKHTIPYAMSIEEQIDLLHSLRPTVLEGYASRLAQVAKELEKRRSTDLRPHLIVSNSEKLDSISREQIRRGFRVNPVNFYDTWEFGIVAWECPKHEGLHVNEDLLKVEILKDNGMPAEPGEQGEVVITDMFNRAMPLIRYGTGDFAVRREAPCSCGRTFFLLDGILGRVSERCFFSDGTYAMATTPLNAIISHDPNCSDIIDYQGIQDRRGEIDLMLVTGGVFSKNNEAHLKKRILQNFPLDKLTIRYVNKIDRTSMGKLKSFVSNIR